jgi:hypothetical protein
VSRQILLFLKNLSLFHIIEKYRFEGGLGNLKIIRKRGGSLAALQALLIRSVRSA